MGGRIKPIWMFPKIVVPPNGFSITNHPFWGTLIVGNTHIIYTLLGTKISPYHLTRWISQLPQVCDMWSFPGGYIWKHACSQIHWLLHVSSGEWHQANSCAENKKNTNIYIYLYIIPKSPGTSKSERTLKGPIAEKLCKCRTSTAECWDLFDDYGSWSL